MICAKDLKENSLPFIENNLENKTKELLEKIKELEYWQEIEKRRADLDAGNGKVMTLEQAIKYAEEKAKAEGIEL